jgi:hypothetical protein
MNSPLYNVNAQRTLIAYGRQGMIERSKTKDVGGSARLVCPTRLLNWRHRFEAGFVCLTGSSLLIPIAASNAANPKIIMVDDLAATTGLQELDRAWRHGDGG